MEFDVGRIQALVADVAVVPDAGTGRKPHRNLRQ